MQLMKYHRFKFIRASVLKTVTYLTFPDFSPFICYSFRSNCSYIIYRLVDCLFFTLHNFFVIQWCLHLFLLLLGFSLGTCTSSEWTSRSSPIVLHANKDPFAVTDTDKYILLESVACIASAVFSSWFRFLPGVICVDSVCLQSFLINMCSPTRYIV